MTRTYDTLGRRILRILEPEGGGPRKQNVLRGIGRAGLVDRAVRRLLKRRMVRWIGGKKNRRLALARPPRPA